MDVNVVVVDRLSCSSTFTRLEGEVTISISDDGDDEAVMDKSTTAASDAEVVVVSAAGRFFLDVKPKADKAFVVFLGVFFEDLSPRLVLLVDDDPLPPLALGGELDIISRVYYVQEMCQQLTTNHTTIELQKLTESACARRYHESLKRFEVCEVT